MTCECKYVGDPKDRRVATCGLHHWLQQGVRLTAVREALEKAGVPEEQRAAIVTNMVPSHDYIDAFGWAP